MVDDSCSTKEATSKKSGSKNWPLILIGIGMLFLLLGKIPFLGPLIVAFAPDFLLLGIALTIVRTLPLENQPTKRIAVLILTLVILGLNTRIPSMISDLVWRKDEVNLTNKINLSTGDSISLDTNVAELSARHRPYAGSHPHCNEGFCAIITGFSPPATFLGIDYWRENPAQSIKSFGYAIANDPDKKVPTLKIRATQDDYALVVDLELLDNLGKLVSSERKIYRNGFPLESRDLDGKGGRNYPFLWAIEYIVHGNMVASFVGRRFGYSEALPAGHFLNSSIQRYVQQDDPRFTQLLESVVEKDVEINSAFSEDVWKATFFDSERSNACKNFVQSEKVEIDVPDFTVGSAISDMGKARSPFKFLRGKNGSERILIRMGDITLCEGDHLYILARVNNYTEEEISKYRYDGTFIYRVRFKKPPSSPGLMAGVSPTSLIEKDGALKFKYVDFVNSGQTRSINRIRDMLVTPKQN